MVARYLVTGASGFIGRAVCARLQAEGAEVHALLRRPAVGPWRSASHCDLTQEAPAPESLVGVTGVVHLAGVAHQAASIAAYHAGNVEATTRLLQACQAAQIPRLVFISSVKAMGETTLPAGIDETASCQPTTPYGQSKYAAEQRVWASHLPEPVVLRLPLVYGPGVKGNLASLLRWTQRGLIPPLPETGNRRSLVHVADVAQAIAQALTQPAAVRQTYLICEAHAYSAGEIGQLLRQALGYAPARWPWPVGAWWALALCGEGVRRCGLPAPLDLALYHKLFDSACYHATKAQDELGFRPQFDLARGLRQMVLTR